MRHTATYIKIAATPANILSCDNSQPLILHTYQQHGARIEPNGFLNTDKRVVCSKLSRHPDAS